MTIKIKELPESERPYEKLEMYGEKMLSNSELLAIILKSGTKEKTSIELANEIISINNIKSLKYLQDVTIEEFKSIKGIGKVKAIQLKAICELAKRMSRPNNEIKVQIKQPQDIVDIVMDELRYEKREIIKLIILNTKNIVLKSIDISIGGTSSAQIEPKEILAEPIKIGAPKIILIHNHPSGDSTPSISDFSVTKRICEASELLGIQLLDHIVIGDGNYTSIFSELKDKNF
ncbi:MAG TPA: DNA repair protein RadC [Clostridia bacterium]|nr:DNA repair protein RadC [Bacteroidales bacterium]HOZ54877.1 DNA repair protein RadC [Clostridia bacterium]